MRISVLYKHTHTSKSTANNICMPSSNKGVRCCHTNIVDSSFNGAFYVYIIRISYGKLLRCKIQKFKWGVMCEMG
mgnify:FL=1